MRGIYLFVRRCFDIVFSAVAILLLLPVLMVISLLILLTMGRPILFKQERQGHKGRFVLLKFRTMVKNAEQIGGGYMAPELNLIPPFGSFLRKSSLDEIPQLVNIFKGDMSFVGPRPALPSQVARYSEEQRGRLQVPQGITGLAQIRYRNNAPWSLRIKSDLEYVSSIGPILDLRILAATPGKVLRANGVRTDQTIEDVDDLAREK
jgi:lipopolysaccharide/colanic/teichoic acid biosynthesis glycosyltransferase